MVQLSTIVAVRPPCKVPWRFKCSLATVNSPIARPSPPPVILICELKFVYIFESLKIPRERWALHGYRLQRAELCNTITDDSQLFLRDFDGVALKSAAQIVYNLTIFKTRSNPLDPLAYSDICFTKSFEKKELQLSTQQVTWCSNHSQFLGRHSGGFGFLNWARRNDESYWGRNFTWRSRCREMWVYAC